MGVINPISSPAPAILMITTIANNVSHFTYPMSEAESEPEGDFNFIIIQKRNSWNNISFVELVLLVTICTHDRCR